MERDGIEVGWEVSLNNLPLASSLAVIGGFNQRRSARVNTFLGIRCGTSSKHSLLLNNHPLIESTLLRALQSSQ